MSDNKETKPIEGEIVEKAEAIGHELETDIRDAAKRGGVFIGTLNIMTQPARNLLTEPLADLYKSRYHGKFKRPKHVFAFDMGLIALGAALAVVSIYFGLIYKPFETVQAKLDMAPKSPIVGGEIVLNLTVTNNGNDAIENVEATVKLPTQIKFERASLPFDRANQTVNLGAIDAKSDATVRIVGTLNGAVGQNIKASANIVYENASGNTAKKNAAATVKIAGSSVGAEFALPDNIIAGQIVSGDIRYFNHGNAPADNIVITPIWPQNFVLNSSKPMIKNNAWFVGALAPGTEGNISWSGTVGGGSASVNFGLETGVKNGSDILMQSQAVKTVALVDLALAVTLDGEPTARLGDMVTLTATYKNAGNHTLTAARVTGTIDPDLTIANIDRPNLGDIKPGTSGIVKIKLQINNKLSDALKNSIDPRLAVRVSVSGELDGAADISISSPAWNIKIASELDLTSAARYWSASGDQLGRGPLPPTVGTMTSYWIFWNIKNTTGAIANARITGTLPANIDFTGKVSAPYGDTPVYDPATRTVTWNAGAVPSWPGVTSSAYGAAFEVSLVPTADQVKTYPKLLIDQKITGTDAVTGLALGNSTVDLTTHLTSDPQAAGTGMVK